MTGTSTLDSQKDRWIRVLAWWTTLSNRGKDLMLMGDVNLDLKKWNDDSYQLKSFVDQTRGLQADGTLSQLVQGDTRVAMVEGGWSPPLLFTGM